MRGKQQTRRCVSTLDRQSSPAQQQESSAFRRASASSRHGGRRRLCVGQARAGGLEALLQLGLALRLRRQARGRGRLARGQRALLALRQRAEALQLLRRGGLGYPPGSARRAGAVAFAVWGGGR